MTTITEIRRKVCLMACKIIKRGVDASTAFKFSWALVKKGLNSKVAGTTFDNRQALLKRLAKYNPTDIKVTLNRESDNSADPNAIAVHVHVTGKGSAKIGYLPAKVALLIAAILDKGMLVTTAFKAVTGGGYGKPNMGMRFELQLVS